MALVLPVRLTMRQCRELSNLGSVILKIGRIRDMDIKRLKKASAISESAGKNPEDRIAVSRNIATVYLGVLRLLSNAR